MLKKILWTLVFLTCGAVTAAAQSGLVTESGSAPANPDQHAPSGLVGIGAQVGDPSGLSLKLYRPSQRTGFLGSVQAFTFLAAWNLDDFFFLNAHALWERPITDSPLNYYFGPGAVLGIDDRPARDSDVVVGASADFGINFYTERFEVFLELTPWIKLIPDTDVSLGYGVGLRFYL